MKLENQVCSLELAKRLKELGFKQESFFWWVHKWEGSSDKDAGEDIISIGYDEYNTLPICRAFNVAELGEMLPKKCYSFKRADNKYWCIIWHDSDEEKDIDMSYDENIEETLSDTEADARAKFLIYLKENDIVK